MNNLKNMLVLKDLPSNLIEEAYVVLNPSLKLKIQDINNVSSKVENKDVIDKSYILQEAKYVLLNYISKYETRKEKITIRELEQKLKKSKKMTLITVAAFLAYIIVTIIF